MRVHRLALLVLAFASVGGSAAALAPEAVVTAAQADGPTVEASPSSELTAGQVVSVTGRGYAPGQGVYVQLCAEPTGALGTAEGRARRCNPDQADDHTVWKTPVDPSGTFTVNLKVEPAFGDVDCRVDTCGVFTRRDHMGGAEDFSQDAFGAVSFAAAGAAPAAPAAAPSGSTAPAAVRATASTAAANQLASTGSSSTLAIAGITCTALGALLLAARRIRTS